MNSYVIVLACNGASQEDVEEVLAFAQERGFWEVTTLPIEGEVAEARQRPSVQRFLRSTGYDKSGRMGGRLRQLGIVTFSDFAECKVRAVWIELTKDDPEKLGGKCFLRILEKMSEQGGAFADWNLEPEGNIEVLNLSTLIKNTLRLHGVEEVAVLKRLEDSDILDLHHLGSKTLADIKEAIEGPSLS